MVQFCFQGAIGVAAKSNVSAKGSSINSNVTPVKDDEGKMIVSVNFEDGGHC